MLEKTKMRFNSKKGFAKMNKNRNMEDRIWGQVMQLNPPMMQKASEEIRSGDSETVQDIRLKYYSFVWSFMRKRFS